MGKLPGLAALVLAVVIVPAAASDRPRPIRAAPFYDVRPGEAVGCYWDRGRQFCGHYCYWEVNGRRYCQRREEIAVPQGAWIDDYVLDEGRSTAYRRPYSRVRRATRGPRPW
jgi:hypothetical protein